MLPIEYKKRTGEHAFTGDPAVVMGDTVPIEGSVCVCACVRVCVCACTSCTRELHVSLVSPLSCSLTPGYLLALGHFSAHTEFEFDDLLSSDTCYVIEFAIFCWSW